MYIYIYIYTHSRGLPQVKPSSHAGTQAGGRAHIGFPFCWLGFLGAAFGSLVSGALMQALDGGAGLSGWRWLFIVQVGLYTI